MYFPIHIDTISMDLSILYLKGSRVEVLNFIKFLHPEIVLSLIANSADPA